MEENNRMLILWDRYRGTAQFVEGPGAAVQVTISQGDAKEREIHFPSNVKDGDYAVTAHYVERNAPSYPERLTVEHLRFGAPPQTIE